MKLHCEWRIVPNVPTTDIVKEMKSDGSVYVYRDVAGWFVGCFRCLVYCPFRTIEEAQHWCELQLAHKFAEEICEGD